MKFKVGDKVKYVGWVYTFYTGYEDKEFGFVEGPAPNYPDVRVNFSGQSLTCHEEELELVTPEKPKQYLIEWSDGYKVITDNLGPLIDDFDGDTRVWELGDELVKEVTWRKKDA